MNLMEVIHQRWAAAAALDDLLPVERVFTGLNVDRDVPYAAIRKRADRPLSRHNDGSAAANVALRIEIFHDDHDAALAILHQVKTAFDTTAFDLSGNDKVLDMRRVDDWERQGDDRVWQLTIDFNCTIHLAAGV
ncbi:hypothetical protein ES707_09504 [subsurface metagenome]